MASEKKNEPGRRREESPSTERRGRLSAHYAYPGLYNPFPTCEFPADAFLLSYPARVPTSLRGSGAPRQAIYVHAPPLAGVSKRSGDHLVADTKPNVGQRTRDNDKLQVGGWEGGKVDREVGKARFDAFVRSRTLRATSAKLRLS